jgi:hypothetical protein
MVEVVQRRAARWARGAYGIISVTALLQDLGLLRGCSMATSILHSQNFRFHITIYLVRNWDFLA